MGLDTVELIMELEDEFEISLPDEDAVKLRTLGDIQEYILRLTLERKVLHCPNQHAFYHVRRTLMKVGNFCRESIRPDSAMQDFLPSGEKKTLWSQLSDSCDYPWPKLTLNSKIVCWLLLMPLGIAMGAFYFGLVYGGTGDAFVIAAFACVLSFVVYALILRYLSKIPSLLAVPRIAGTVGDLSRHIARSNYFKESASGDIWRRISRVVSEFTGVDEKDLNPTTDILRDLF